MKFGWRVVFKNCWVMVSVVKIGWFTAILYVRAWMNSRTCLQHCSIRVRFCGRLYISLWTYHVHKIKCACVPGDSVTSWTPRECLCRTSQNTRSFVPLAQCPYLSVTLRPSHAVCTVRVRPFVAAWDVKRQAVFQGRCLRCFCVLPLLSTQCRSH